jgi:bacterioferritin (cytochrome b1)
MEITMNHHVFRPPANTPQRDPLPRPAGVACAPGINGNAAPAIEVLNQALTMARAVALRCAREYHMALRHRHPSLAAAALEHAYEVRRHSARIGTRIHELGGDVDRLANDIPPPGPVEPDACNLLIALIEDDLMAARSTLDSYREMADFVAPFDPSTHHMLKEIIVAEGEHTGDLAALLVKMAARPVQ